MTLLNCEGEGGSGDDILAELATVGIDQSKNAENVWDLWFDQANAVLNGHISAGPGHPVWACSGAGALTAGINDRVLTSPGNVYCYLRNGGNPVGFISTSFSLRDPGVAFQPEAATAVLIASRDETLPNMLHLECSQDHWSFSKFVAGVSTLLGTGKLNLQLVPAGGALKNGPRYAMAMDIDETAGTVIVIPPDNIPRKFTDAAITTIAARYGALQVTVNGATVGGAGTTTGFHGIAMGRSFGPSYRALGGGSDAADADALWSKGLAKRTQLRATLSGGVGWYRVALQTSDLVTFLISGKMILTAQDGIGGQYWEVDLDGRLNGTGFFTQVFGTTVARTVIDQIRLSGNGVETVGLDVHLANATACTLQIDFDGSFKPVPYPAVGAVSLGTAFTTTYSGGTPRVVSRSGAIAKNTVTPLFSIPVNEPSGIEIALTVNSGGVVDGYAAESSQWVSVVRKYAGAAAASAPSRVYQEQDSNNAGTIAVTAVITVAVALGVATFSLETQVTGTDVTAYSPPFSATVTQTGSPPVLITWLV